MPNKEYILDLMYKIGQFVYLKTDPEQCEWLCTGYVITYNEIRYLCKQGENQQEFYDFELSGCKCNYGIMPGAN